MKVIPIKNGLLELYSVSDYKMYNELQNVGKFLNYLNGE